MHKHAPDDYDCPFCRIIQTAKTRMMDNDEQSDVIYQNNDVTVFLALGRKRNNPVDVLVVPNVHYENIFDLPIELSVPLHRASLMASRALKAVYDCDGISIRQHNEPAGDQDVWHYHMHVTPRFIGDNFYRSSLVHSSVDERLIEAHNLRAANHLLEASMQESMQAAGTENVALIMRFNQALNAGDLETMMSLLAPDCIFENTYPPPDGERYVGKVAVRQFWEEFLRGSQSARLEFEEAFGQGQRAVLRWTYTWTGLDGVQGHIRGVDVYRIENGLITEKLSYVKG